KVDLPAPFTPAINIYFFTKKDSFQSPDAVFFAAGNHQPSHKNPSVLPFPLPMQAVTYPPAEEF
ncbi:MAG: hypothetical protein NC302_13010, partial [Bacteroidales bacterium]|nr:hypothetical protein [Bacteroidales bacterium]